MCWDLRETRWCRHCGITMGTLNLGWRPCDVSYYIKEMFGQDVPPWFSWCTWGRKPRDIENRMQCCVECARAHPNNPAPSPASIFQQDLVDLVRPGEVARHREKGKGKEKMTDHAYGTKAAASPGDNVAQASTSIAGGESSGQKATEVPEHGWEVPFERWIELLGQIQRDKGPIAFFVTNTKRMDFYIVSPTVRNEGGPQEEAEGEANNDEQQPTPSKPADEDR